jgi:hypothetical protein
LTESGWFSLVSGRFPGPETTSDAIVGITDGSDGQTPTASLFNLMSIRHNIRLHVYRLSDPTADPTIRFDRIQHYGLRCVSESWNPDEFTGCYDIT